MAIVYTKTDQGLTVATGTGAPVHTAIAGDRYTDTANGNTYQYTTSWQIISYGASGVSGSGTTNYVSKFTGTSAIGNSLIQDDGTTVGLGIAPNAGVKLYVSSSAMTAVAGITSLSGSQGVTGSSNGIGVGTNVGSKGSAAFSTATNVGVQGESTGGTLSYGGEFNGSNGSNYSIGVIASGLSTGGTIALGGYFYATGGLSNYSLRLQDGTQGIGKVLTSMTANGDAQWQTPAGGLTYFTEGQNTTAPNATVPVDSLTAVTATTNGDIAIVPKGTGAFSLAVADNLVTGGNKRGTNAVDLQSIRSSNSQVASGVSSFLAGNGSTASGSYSSAIGNLNFAIGVYSSAIGYGNTSSGNVSYTFGSSCTASNANAIAMGNRAKATGDSSICLASYFYSDSTASGGNSTLVGCGTVAGSFALGLGFQVTTGGAQATAIGYSSNTFSTIGRVAIGGVAGGTGEAQKGIIQYRQRTTDATPTILTTNNAVAFGDNAGSQLALQNQQVMRFKGSITAKKSGTTDIAIWDIDGVIVRGANAASTVLTVGNVNVVTNIPAWVTPTLAANTSVNVGGLLITITGVIATNIQWFAAIDTVENIYA